MIWERILHSKFFFHRIPVRGIRYFGFVLTHKVLTILFPFTRHPFTEFLSRIQYFGTMLTHKVLTTLFLFTRRPSTPHPSGMASTSPTTYVVGLTTLFPVQNSVLRHQLTLVSSPRVLRHQLTLLGSPPYSLSRIQYFGTSLRWCPHRRYFGQGVNGVHTLAYVVGIRKAGSPAFLMFSLWVDLPPLSRQKRGVSGTTDEISVGSGDLIWE